MKNILLGLVFTIATQFVIAQIVNVEKKRQTESGLNATLKFSYSLKQTGSMLSQLSNTADIQYHKNSYSFILLNDLSFLRYDGGDLINDGFQHLRHNYTFKDSSFLTFETFAQHQYNEKKLLKQRIIFGGGFRFRLINKSKFSWYFAPLVMFEHERLSSENETVTDISRVDAYTNINISFSDLISFSHISYYQPKITDFNDFRYSGETGIELGITKHFAYLVSFALDYDSMPPVDVDNVFYYFKNQLTLKF